MRTALPLTAPPVPARTAWGAVAVTVLAGVVAAAGIGKLIGALPAVSADLGIGLTLGGVLLGAFTVVSAVCGAALGTVVDRLGAARTLLAGLLLVAAGSALGGLTTAGGQLLVTTAVEGAGFVAVVVAAPTLVSRAVAPADTGFALGLWGTYMPVGQATMAVAAPVVLAAWTWRGVWFVNAGLLVVCAAVAWLVLVRTPAGSSAGVAATGELGRDVVAALRTPAPRLLALAFGAYVILFSVTSFLPTIYVSQGSAVTTATLLTGSVIVTNALGNLAGGVLLRRGAPFWVLMVVAATVTGVAAVGVFGLDAPLALAYACALVFAAAAGLLPAAVLAAVPALVPRPGLVPITNGLIVQAIGVGMVVGPIASGALADAVGGWHATPLVVTTAAALALVAALRVRRLERGPTRDRHGAEDVANPV